MTTLALEVDRSCRVLPVTGGEGGPIQGTRTLRFSVVPSSTNEEDSLRLTSVARQIPTVLDLARCASAITL